MNHKPGSMIFESATPVCTDPLRTVAVYCSDGRFGDQIDDLLHRGLKLAHFDRLVVPGGPACLAGHPSCFFEAQSAQRQLQFLVETHHLQHVVLIAHDDCKYYLHHLRVFPQDLQTQQRKDLEEAARRVQQISRGLSVHALLAHLEKDQVRFELIEF